jgi:hypothetical protein
MTDDNDPISGTPGAWYAVFYGKGRRTLWWDWLCRPGFQHVLAFGYEPRSDRWLVYDVTQARTYVRAYEPAEFPRWLDALPDGHKILLFEADDAPARPFWRTGFWCVPATAHLIGAPSRALRPEGLYRDLVRLGAKPAFERPRP